ncbi:MAG: long-chain fatty acid--CoA ligase [Pseudanabaenales cyanobacterium]|nr:long-chain fatty acid--CoA ligase [Pseudanabaenales cyanobacterium]
MNITHHIEQASRLFPQKDALKFEDNALSYSELNQRANRLANGLRRLGVKTGDRVALFLPNRPDFVIAYLGALKLGAIAVSLNVMLKSSEVEFILNDCTAKVLITTQELSQEVPLADSPHLEALLIADGQATRGISLSHLMAEASPTGKAVEMAGDAAAAIVYTSGTTGFPKGATLSHRNIITNMHAQRRCCDMRSDDRLLLYLPLFHCFGQNAILNSGFSACATIVLQGRFKPEQFLEAISAERVTMVFGVPTVFIKLLNLDTASCDLSSVRFYFSAAASLPEEVAQRWREKHGYIIHEGYGLTESSPCACYNHNLTYKSGSIGRPIEEVEMKVVDANGVEVPPGELGEVIIRGPNVMLGYWNRPLDTAKVLKNGWLHTGDIGRMDAEGYFYIVDRLKDMINVSGFKVYPAEVENVLYQHPAIAEAAAYGVADPLKGELVKANILIKSGQFLTTEQLMDFCSERMAVYKIPRTFNFVSSIPKNPTGKILKRLLRQDVPAPLTAMSR